MVRVLRGVLYASWARDSRHAAVGQDRDDLTQPARNVVPTGWVPSGRQGICEWAVRKALIAAPGFAPRWGMAANYDLNKSLRASALSRGLANATRECQSGVWVASSRRFNTSSRTESLGHRVIRAFPPRSCQNVARAVQTDLLDTRNLITPLKPNHGPLEH